MRDSVPLRRVHNGLERWPLHYNILVFMLFGSSSLGAYECLQALLELISMLPILVPLAIQFLSRPYSRATPCLVGSTVEGYGKFLDWNIET